jgi:hypothetical protein
MIGLMLILVVIFVLLNIASPKAQRGIAFVFASYVLRLTLNSVLHIYLNDLCLILFDQVINSKKTQEEVSVIFP